MKPIFCIFFMLCISIFLFAQEREAKIIFLDSTSIKGYGEIKKEKIYFRVDQKRESTEWDSEMVLGIIFEGYGFSEEYEYVLIKDKKKPVLMEVIERGNLNLYKDTSYGLKMGMGFSVGSNGVNAGPVGKYDYSESYYVKRVHEDVAINLANRFKKTAPEYFSDCPTLIEKIKNKELDVDTIPDIVFYYNDYCNDYFKE